MRPVQYPEPLFPYTVNNGQVVRYEVLTPLIAHCGVTPYNFRRFMRAEAGGPQRLVGEAVRGHLTGLAVRHRTDITR